MTENEKKKVSKFLSYVLRHAPEKAGLELDNAGWAEVDVLLPKLKIEGQKISFENLEEVVATNPKQRFAFNKDKSKIRANQGHSIAVDHGYLPIKPPTILLHGTGSKNEQSILEGGLIKGNRHHVHLSEDLTTAISVGQRHGKPIVFEVAALEMYEQGFEFYLSENNVWLTDFVPAKFLKKLDN